MTHNRFFFSSIIPFQTYAVCAFRLVYTSLFEIPGTRVYFNLPVVRIIRGKSLEMLVPNGPRREKACIRGFMNNTGAD